MITPTKQRQVQRELQREHREQLRQRAAADKPGGTVEVCADCPDRECLFCPYGAAGFLLATAA